MLNRRLHGSVGRDRKEKKTESRKERAENGRKMDVRTGYC